MPINRIFKSSWFLILVLNLNFTENFAQHRINIVDVEANIISPAGFFKRNVFDNKAGIGFSYLHQYKPYSPLFFGFDYHYFNINRASAVLEQVVNFYIDDFNFTTKSGVNALYAKCRFYPDIYLWKFQLFVEPLIGYKFMITSTSSNALNQEDVGNFKIESFTSSLSYGMNLGFNFKITNNLFFSYKYGYIAGLSTPYYILDENGPTLFSTFDRFARVKSTTNIYRHNIGLSITW